MKAILAFFIIWVLVSAPFRLCGINDEAAMGLGLGVMVLIPASLMFYYHVIPSGKKKARAIRISKLRKERENKAESDSLYVPEGAADKITDGDPMMSEEERQYYAERRRQRLWMEEMRLRGLILTEPVGGRRMYKFGLLGISLPLDEFEEYVGTPLWNHELSRYIDWEKFRKAYPYLPTFEIDFDTYRDEIDEDYY